MKNNNQSLRSNQKGMVSIIITMVLIILMTLIVLAMSQNANREQRQSLDRQLSDQAFYNAESGITDWANYLYENPGLPFEKTKCDTNVTGTPYDAPGDDPIPEIGTNGVNKYSCILYDKAPKSIEFDNMTIEDSNTVSIESVGGSIHYLMFKWKTQEGASKISGCNQTPGSPLPQTLGPNCDVGGLRIDLINSDGTRADIQNNNFVAFLLPKSTGGGSMNYSAGDQGSIGQGNCSTGGVCSLRLNFAPPMNQKMYLHIKSIYSGNDVTITGCQSASPVCPSGQEVRFNNAQIMIDSTGKSNDVLRRVQVRIPASDTVDGPGSFSLKTTQNICKLVTVNSQTGTATPDGRCPL